MIHTIALREFKNQFLSPLAWTILAVLQFIFAYLFLTQVEAFNSFQTRLAGVDNAPGLTDVIVMPLFANAAVILLLVTPLLTMRLICEERRNKTLSLLLSAPLATYEIILGKYLGVLALLMSVVMLMTLMPLSLLVGGTLDFGKLFSNVLGLTLLVSAFSAVGLYMSAIAGHPTVAAISSFGLLILLWMLDISRSIRGNSSELFDYLSMLNHFQSLQTGLLNTEDISYFLLFIATFLFLSIRRLENDRLQK
ncbi:MAG: ABC transporter permease subunit [Methylococcaceae bacterium]|nr:ABC transporter permease subunit [Methylococcaceae bacterium]